jgi:type VI secretion system ImpB/VipA family protein
MHAHRPRRRFGQNFLVDRAYVDRIIQSIDPLPDDCAVEIGPGFGALTVPLMQRVSVLHVIEIDRDNFDKVLAGMTPRLAFRVDDKLSGKEGNQLNVELKFRSIDDFEPANVVNQVDPLRKLLETRNKLKDLLSKMDGNDKLEELLENIVKDSQSREELTKALGLEGSGSPDQPA